MSPLIVIALAFALAFLSESLVEYVFGEIFNHVTALAKLKWLLMYVAALVGVGLAFYYKLDLISLITESDATPVGMILSGLILGRGANYLHQFVSKYLPKAMQVYPFEQ